MSTTDYIIKEIPNSNIKVYLRNNQFDEDIFKAIFIEQEYDYIRFLEQPETIIDAGANIGLASILFAMRYPDARIIAVEPADDNFELLKINTASFGNIIPVYAALMDDDGYGSLVNSYNSTLGYQVIKSDGNIQMLTIPTLCRQYDIEQIDFLKMDIEGAEKGIFNSSDYWLDNVKCLVIELHERTTSGCNKAVFDAIRDRFESEWIGGENFFFSYNNFAVPTVPEAFKTENPQPLPIELSWVYRDRYDEMYTKVCAEKDAVIDETRKALDELSHIHTVVCAEKDAAIEYERKEHARQIEEMQAVFAERDEIILSQQKKLTEYQEKYSSPAKALFSCISHYFCPHKREKNRTCPRAQWKKFIPTIFLMLVLLVSFALVFWGESNRQEIQYSYGISINKSEEN